MRLKLDANENPIPLPKEAREGLTERLASTELSRYPDGEAWELRRALARYAGVDIRQVLVGNGGDEVIFMACHAFALGGRVAVVGPTFEMYEDAARSLGAEVFTVQLDGDFLFEPGEVIAARPDLVFICRPNNPTGNLYPPQLVLECLRSGAVVFVDEAYIEFSLDAGMSRFLASEERLMIGRTMSKAFGLAGVRLGYVLAPEELVRRLERVRQPYNVGCLAQAAGLFMLENLPLVESMARRIRAWRQDLYRGLQAIDGIEAYPSETNFILFRPLACDPDLLWRALRDKGVLIRRYPGHQVLRKYLRVSVGTPEENALFLKTLGEILGGVGDKDSCGRAKDTGDGSQGQALS